MNTRVGVGLRVLSLAMGLFLIAMGTTKLDWISDTSILTAELQKWHQAAPAASRWYLESIAIPGAPVFARLVLLGELATGAALVCGFRVRAGAAVAFVMVLTFHFASGLLFQYSYLRNSFGLPVLGNLLALAIGGRKLPLSVSK
jgi:uncharacterized membrane protein YphA (DoxX/SURF4 family)